MQIGVTEQEHPALFGDAEPAGSCDRHENDSSSLIHLVAGDDQTWVGLGDHPVRFVQRDQLGGGAFDRRSGERIVGRDSSERSEQRAHLGRVFLPAQLEPGATGIVEQRVLAGAVHQAMHGEMWRCDVLQPVAAVLEAPTDGLGEVGLVGGLGVVPHGGDCFRTEHERDLGVAGRDRSGQLGDQVLWRLPAGHFEDRPRGFAPTRAATARG